MNSIIRNEQTVFLVELFNAPKIKDVEKLIKGKYIDHDEFALFILTFKQELSKEYSYLKHYDEVRTGDRRFTKDSSPSSLKDFQMQTERLSDRVYFYSHLFYSPDHEYWHLFYFTQSDVSQKNNHYQGGVHLHYSRESHTQKTLEQIWAGVKSTPRVLPRAVHISFKDSVS